jgi:hypothetical protein
MELQSSKPNLIGDSERITSNFDVQYSTQQISHPPVNVKLLPQDMCLSALADCCMSEVNNYQKGEHSDDQFGIELFRRALTERDPLAWEFVQQCFHNIMLGWMRIHPMRKVAIQFDSDENYVVQAFTRFWQAAAVNQNIEFRSLAAALRYLRATLNATILDTLRAYSRARETPLPEPGESGELIAREQDDGLELWEVIRHLIPDERQQRVAYLLFHCRLKPREIVHHCSEEFSDVQEIYRLRRNIFERLLRNADYIRSRLDNQFQ